MAKSERQSRTRILADRYAAATGEHVYSGHDERARYYFSDGLINGHDAALAHMILLCERAGVPTE
jgi:hypothetical protein